MFKIDFWSSTKPAYSTFRSQATELILVNISSIMVIKSVPSVLDLSGSPGPMYVRNSFVKKIDRETEDHFMFLLAQLNPHAIANTHVFKQFNYYIPNNVSIQNKDKNSLHHISVLTRALYIAFRLSLFSLSSFILFLL